MPCLRIVEYPTSQVQKTQLLLSALLEVMPNEGEATIKHMIGVLADHGMKLERVSDEYRKK